MQIDASDIHDAEHTGQDKRDTQGNDDARTDAQAEEADDENDDNCLPQGANEIRNGVFDDFRLI